MEKKNKEIKWVSPEQDFEDLHQDGQYTDMVQLAEENVDLLISLYQRDESEELEKSVQFGTVMLSYFQRSLQKDKEEEALFWAGKLMGCLEVLDRLRFSESQDQMAAERARLLGTKHLNDIVFALETHGTMTQTELGDALKLQASTLSEILKKVRKTQLIQASPYGKYKVYSLTEEGVRYSAVLRKRSRADLAAPEENRNDSKEPERFQPNISGALVKPGDVFSIWDTKGQACTKYDVEIILQTLTNNQRSMPLVFIAAPVEDVETSPNSNMMPFFGEKVFQNIRENA